MRSRRPTRRPPSASIQIRVRYLTRGIGGSQEQFQNVQNAFNTLSDPSKRRQYDQELRVAGSKDGLSIVPKSKPAAAQEERVGSSAASRDTKRHKSGVVAELPANPGSLSIGELKELCASLGLTTEGCFEKQDFVDKLVAYKKARSGGIKSPKASAPVPSMSDPEADSGPHELPNTLAAIKVISAGQQEVGKSCLIKRYCEGRFVKRYIPTIGVDYGVKVVDTKSGSAAVHFFDLSGNDDFKLIRLDFFSNAQGCLMVFDVNDKESFRLLPQWEEEMRANGLDLSKLQTVVIGNKTDMGHREVPEAEAHKWARAHGYAYFDCSASSGSNVATAFDCLFNGVMKTTADTRKAYGISA